jgi:hypothetical protein
MVQRAVIKSNSALERLSHTMTIWNDNRTVIRVATEYQETSREAPQTQSYIAPNLWGRKCVIGRVYNDVLTKFVQKKLASRSVASPGHGHRTLQSSQPLKVRPETKGYVTSLSPTMYMFFWVSPRRQIKFCRRFGTLSNQSDSGDGVPTSCFSNKKVA